MYFRLARLATTKKMKANVSQTPSMGANSLGCNWVGPVSTRLFLRMTQYAIRAKGTNMNRVTQNAPQPVYT